MYILNTKLWLGGPNIASDISDSLGYPRPGADRYETRGNLSPPGVTAGG